MGGQADVNLVTARLDVRKSTTPQRETEDGHLGPARALRDGTLVNSPYITALGMEGRVYISSDADQNDMVTGQTSYADTTPTLMLDVPEGVTAIPLGVFLSQDGTVGGGEILVHIEIDHVVRYASAGTAEAVLSSRTDMPLPNQCTLYSGATAVAGYGILVYGGNFPQDVDPAVADDINWHQFLWTPTVPMFLVGPAALLVYTYAGATGPSYYWNVKWAEIPSSDLE